MMMDHGLVNGDPADNSEIDALGCDKVERIISGDLSPLLGAGRK
ncbi:MAG TPA: hypothetical protein VME17_14425 [Bryobacteraceae bacterium]|nr:hypothetical protein [Bryobacteraceae bacterium]